MNSAESSPKSDPSSDGGAKSIIMLVDDSFVLRDRLAMAFSGTWLSRFSSRQL